MNNKTPTKRKDECFMCSSRSCYTRVKREEEPKFDEVTCIKHMKVLYKYVDNTLGVNNGIIRTYISSTGKLKRGG